MGPGIGPEILNIPGSIPCHIVGRENRFVVNVRIEGHTHRACINNTGRLQEFLVTGREGFCVPTQGGKTDFRLFSVSDQGLGALIDTRLQMRAFERALELALIPWLDGCVMVKRDARLGTSKIDYLLECGSREIYIEIKSAVLRDDHFAMYPDCPTPRGRRHFKELTDYVGRGGQAVIVFVAALPGVVAFKPNRTADEALYTLLREAKEAGVGIRSLGMAYSPGTSAVYLTNPDLALELI